MSTAEFPRARPGLVAYGFSVLLLALPGCIDSEVGTVSSTPKAATEVGQVAPSTKKGGPAPRVPRGPEQAKALQEATAK